MERLKNSDEITDKDIEKIYNAIAKFDKYISLVREPTIDENELYERWDYCVYAIMEAIYKWEE